MHAAGHPYSAIGEALGITRSAVSGRVLRLKLPHRKDSQNKPKRPRRRGRAFTDLRIVRHITERAPELPQPRRSEISRTAYGSPCDLLALTASSCRWPISDGPPHKFCNAARAGEGSYCVQHQRVACR